jgi:nucleoid-associated protein YgaU
MRDATGRVILGMLALAGLWVAVYWLWPARPAVTYARVEPAVIPRESPVEPVAIEPAEAPPHAQLGADGSRRVLGVIAPRFTEYTLLKGETFEHVALKFFGSRDMSNVIAAANPLVSPASLKAGRTIRVPRDVSNIQGTPAVRYTAGPAGEQPPPSDPRPLVQEYEVRKGDSLSKIAKTIYGEESLSGVLFEVNRDRMGSPGKLQVGQKLRIPPEADARRLARK